MFCTLCCKIRLVSKILIFGNKIASGLFLPPLKFLFKKQKCRKSLKKIKEHNYVGKCVCVVGIWEFHFKLILGISPFLPAHVSPVYKSSQNF